MGVSGEWPIKNNNRQVVMKNPLDFPDQHTSLCWSGIFYSKHKPTHLCNQRNSFGRNGFFRKNSINNNIREKHYGKPV